MAKTKIEWRTTVVAHSDSQKRHIDVTVSQLKQAGYEGFNVCVARGTRAADREDTAVTRVSELRNDQPDIDYALTIEAISALTTGYKLSADLFMICKPDMLCWEQLQHYCESQIELSRFAAYVMYTPKNTIGGERSRRPEAYNGDGFYRVRTHDPLLSAEAIVMPPFVAQYLLSQLPPAETGVFHTFAHALGVFAHRMPNFELYYHVRSLMVKSMDTSSDFVGVGYVMPNVELTELKPLNPV